MLSNHCSMAYIVQMLSTVIYISKSVRLQYLGPGRSSPSQIHAEERRHHNPQWRTPLEALYPTSCGRSDSKVILHRGSLSRLQHGRSSPSNPPSRLPVQAPARQVKLQVILHRGSLSRLQRCRSSSK